MRKGEPRGGPYPVDVTLRSGGARQGRDYAGGSNDFADCAVVEIGHVDVAFGIRCDTAGKIELCGGSRAISAASDARRTGKSGHDTGRGDLADGVIGIGDINGRACNSDAVRFAEAGCATGAVHIAGAPGRIVDRASKCAHHSSRGNLADFVVAVIGYIHERADAIYGYVSRRIKSRCASCAVRRSVDSGGAGKSAHYPGRSDLADSVIEGVGDINISGVVYA